MFILNGNALFSCLDLWNGGGGGNLFYHTRFYLSN